MTILAQAGKGIAVNLPSAIALPEEDDLRPVIAIAVDGLENYSFPPTSRMGMIAEILSRPLSTERDGIFMSWNIRMDFAWNKSGRVAGGPEVLPEHDARWRKEVKDDQGIFQQACENALMPWLRDSVDLLECEGEMLCGFTVSSRPHDHLLLSSFRDRPMAFESRRAFEDKIISLDDDTLASLWTACRVVDCDLSRRARSDIMAHEYAKIRAIREQDWAYEVDALEF